MWGSISKATLGTSEHWPAFATAAYVLIRKDGRDGHPEKVFDPVQGEYVPYIESVRAEMLETRWINDVTLDSAQFLHMYFGMILNFAHSLCPGTYELEVLAHALNIQPQIYFGTEGGKEVNLLLGAEIAPKQHDANGDLIARDEPMKFNIVHWNYDHFDTWEPYVNKPKRNKFANPFGSSAHYSPLVGPEVVITNKPNGAMNTEKPKTELPGAGKFGDALSHIGSTHFDDAVSSFTTPAGGLPGGASQSARERSRSPGIGDLNRKNLVAHEEGAGHVSEFLIHEEGSAAHSDATAEYERDLAEAIAALNDGYYKKKAQKNGESDPKKTDPP